MRIWIVSLFDPVPTDNARPMRYMSIAKSAIDMGHHVTHFSSTFKHSSKTFRFDNDHEEKINDYYELVLLKTKPYKKNVSITRSLSHLNYSKKLVDKVNSLGKPNIILVALPPIAPAFELCKWAQKNGIPLVVDIIDPWPDAFLKLVSKNIKPWLKIAMLPMYRNLQFILRNCAGVVAISAEYIEWAKLSGYTQNNFQHFLPSVPFKEIQEKINKYRIERPRTDNRLRIIYAGNLGVGYDIPTILKTAFELENRYPGKTLFVIAGMGKYQSLVSEYATKSSNIIYVGRLGYDELIYQYSISDLGLAQYAKNATQSVTYKFFDYLSAGLPILNSLRSEMSVLIKEHQLGLNNDPGDVPSLVSNIVKFLNDSSLKDRLKKNAIDYTRENGDNEIVYKRMIQFLISQTENVRQHY